MLAENKKTRFLECFPFWPSEFYGGASHLDLDTNLKARLRQLEEGQI